MMNVFFKEFFENYYPHAELKKLTNLAPLDADDIENMEYIHLITCPLLDKHADNSWKHYHNNDYLISSYFEDVKDKIVIEVNNESDPQVKQLMMDCIDDFAKMTLIVIPILTDNRVEVIYLYIDDPLLENGSFAKIYWKNTKGEIIHRQIMSDFVDDIKHVAKIINQHNHHISINDVYRALINTYDKIIVHL